LGVELEPFVVEFYSGESPARGLVASALLDRSLKDRYGGRVPLRSIVVVSRTDAYISGIVGRVLEALSNASVDVPPSRVIEASSLPHADLVIAFTREEARGAPGGRPARLLGDLAGLPDREVEDTLGDLSQLVRALDDLIARALPAILLMSRHKHMGDVVRMLEGVSERYRSSEREMSLALSDFPAAAAAIDALDEALMGLVAPDGPLRRYAEAYGNVCTCGGTMQLTSERYRDGIYELTFACNRCGRRVTRLYRGRATEKIRRATASAC